MIIFSAACIFLQRIKGTSKKLYFFLNSFLFYMKINQGIDILLLE